MATKHKPKLRGVVYLIHFARPFKHARHYMGFAEGRDYSKRMAAHRAGRGANLLRVIGKKGIGWRVARAWRNVDRNFERTLKNRGGQSRLCPTCSGPRVHNRGKK